MHKRTQSTFWNTHGKTIAIVTLIMTSWGLNMLSRWYEFEEQATAKGKKASLEDFLEQNFTNSVNDL